MCNKHQGYYQTQMEKKKLISIKVYQVDPDMVDDVVSDIKDVLKVSDCETYNILITDDRKKD